MFPVNIMLTEFTKFISPDVYKSVGPCITDSFSQFLAILFLTIDFLLANSAILWSWKFQGPNFLDLSPQSGFFFFNIS